jgi:hypothetical protein
MLLQGEVIHGIGEEDLLARIIELDGHIKKSVHPISTPMGGHRGKIEGYGGIRNNNIKAAHPYKARVSRFLAGATKRDRTADLRITNALLYQLSYGGSISFYLQAISSDNKQL